MNGYCNWCGKFGDDVVLEGEDDFSYFRETICHECFNNSKKCSICDETTHQDFHYQPGSDTCMECESKIRNSIELLEQTHCCFCNISVDATTSHHFTGGKALCYECNIKFQELLGR